MVSQDRRMSLGVIQPGFVDCQAIGVAVDRAQVEDKVRYLGIQGSAALCRINCYAHSTAPWSTFSFLLICWFTQVFLA